MLTEKQIKELLSQVDDAETRKQLETIFSDLQNLPPDDSMPNSGDKFKRSSVKKALNIISRLGVEIGKHKAISWLLELFD